MSFMKHIVVALLFFLPFFISCRSERVYSVTLGKNQYLINVEKSKSCRGYVFYIQDDGTHEIIVREICE